MTCVCASAITAEMNDWVKLGGGNSGCCGNAAHTFGFHREASAVPASDYSRRHEAAKPVNMSWGCAGDFHHGFNAKLMARHADVLRRLMAGEFPMICEMITKPWPNKPVYYWARWLGNRTLQRYTGKGHDHWSHISWWRSRADQRPHLWVPGGGVVPPRAPSAGTVAPKYPGYVLRLNPAKVDANVRSWQSQARARGIGLTADGRFGQATLSFVKTFQSLNELGSDGFVGVATWAAIFNPKLKVK